MKKVVTARGEFRTGTEVADAVTAYALALARARRLDVVDIPFVAADGSIHRAQMRIGWLIENMVTSAPESAEELIEVDTIIDLWDKARSNLLPPESDHRRQWTIERSDTNWEELI